MIRVLLVDDQTLVRQGIRGLLESSDDVEVIGEADNGVDALAILRDEKQRPDVLLLDVRMPQMGGVELLETLAEESIDIPTVILTTFPDDQALFAALRAGARGYLLKDCTRDELLGAVRAVAAGERSIQPVTLSRVLPGLERVREGETSAPPFGELTAREREVLKLVAGGGSNQEIAAALGNSEGTIKNHVSSILLKLGVRDRTQAVLKAIEHRLL